MSLLERFCAVDDFWQVFGQEWEQILLEDGLKQRCRAGQLCGSEIMTILIYFHTYGELRYQKRYRDFKSY